MVVDLILLDVMLPKLDGYGILSVLKQNKDLGGIPVIMLTSKDSLKDKLKGRFSSASAYLTKPFDPETLISTVAEVLENKDRKSSVFEAVERLETDDDSDVVFKAGELQEKQLFKKYTMQTLLDTVDVIECFEHPKRKLRMGEVLEKQKQIYPKFPNNYTYEIPTTPSF